MVKYNLAFERTEKENSDNTDEVRWYLGLPIRDVRRLEKILESWGYLNGDNKRVKSIIKK